MDRFDAVEIWNSFWTVSDTGLHPTTPRKLADRLAAKGFTAEGIAAPPAMTAAAARAGSANDQALYFWEEHLERRRRIAAVGGSDRHEILLPGYPTTWVLAENPGQDAIVEAVRAGRTVVTAGPAGPRVTFEADADQDGVFEATLGDTIPAGRPAVLRARVEGARDGKLRIVRRRQTALEARIDLDDFTAVLAEAPQPGDWYRLDVFQPIDWALPGASQTIALTHGSAAGASVVPVISLFGVGMAMGANVPIVDFDEAYLRMLCVDLADFSWARAAITSPIYAR